MTMWVSGNRLLVVSRFRPGEEHQGPGFVNRAKGTANTEQIVIRPLALRWAAPPPTQARHDTPSKRPSPGRPLAVR